MEELEQSKAENVLEAEIPAEEFEIKEVSLSDNTEAPKSTKKPIDWLKIGVATTLACSVLSLGFSCAALISKNNDNKNNQSNQSSSNVNHGSSVSISSDGYLVIDGTKTDIKADGSSTEITDAQIISTDKWGISTYVMFTFGDGSYVTTQPKTQVLNDHFYDASTAEDITTLTVTYGASKVRLTNHINITSALEFDSNVEFDLNHKTMMYTASSPIDIADNVSVKFANGNLTFNTSKAMVLGESSSVEFADASVLAQGTIAEVVGDNANIEIVETSITATGKTVEVAETANNFVLNVEDSNLETADAGNVFVSTQEALVTAVADSNITSITLSTNIELANALNIDRDLSINLNGKTITAAATAFNVTNGTIVVDNGTINAINDVFYINATATGSNVFLKLGSNFVATSQNDCCVYLKGTGAKLETSATLTSCGDYATIQGNGNLANKIESITVTGGTISHTSDIAIYAPQTGVINITGGEIIGTTALYIKSGTLNISGGTFTATGDYTGYIYSGDGAKFFGDALVIDACAYPGGNPVVNITGGVFNTQDKDGHKIGYYSYDGNTATITATGYDIYKTTCVSTEASLKSAVANTSISHITISNNLDLSTVIEITRTLTIDLNGKTLTVTNDTEGNGVFMATANGNLTINGDGIVNGVGNNIYNIAVFATQGGKITINGGTYTNIGAGTDDHYDTIYASWGGEIVINGGTFYGQTPDWILNLKDNTNSSITVTGGTFHGFNPANCKTEGVGTNFIANGYTVVENNNVYSVVKEA